VTLYIAARESDPADLAAQPLDVTTNLTKNADVLRQQPVQYPADPPVKEHPLPGLEGFKITVFSDDPQLDIKRRIATEIYDAKILPQARLEFFKRYEKYGRELDHFQAAVVNVTETPTGWKADVEVKLVVKKGERGIYSNTLIETYESQGNGVSFVGSRHGDMYMSESDLR
jgi:hypothetical protein